MSLARTPIIFRTALRARALSTTPLRLAQGPTTKTTDPSGKPQTTQGHTTTKSHGLDVQNANANAGQSQKSQSGGAGANQPIDAARMEGGEAKPGVGKGAFKDQVGGQGSGGVEKGGKTDVPEGGWTGKIKNALTGNKAFHTSARANADSPRKPVEKGLKGDQNEHLKHKDAGASDSGKGNAAKEPHLPSHNKGSSGVKKDTKAGKGGAKGSAGMHTSARVMGDAERKAGYAATHESEPKRAGYDAPAEALPPNIESAYKPSEATPPPKPNMTPSSEAEYSSTAVDPPNQALKEQIKSGSADARNPPPSAEGGQQGLGEAWKNRKIA